MPNFCFFLKKKENKDHVAHVRSLLYYSLSTIPCQNLPYSERSHFSAILLFTSEKKGRKESTFSYERNLTAICEGTKLLISISRLTSAVFPVSTPESAARPGKIPAKSEAASGYSCPPLAPGTECGFAAPVDQLRPPRCALGGSASRFPLPPTVASPSRW